MKHIALTFTVALAACTQAQSTESSQAEAPTVAPTKVEFSGRTDTAILAGGCFWCIESDFEKLSGVVDVVSGYTGDDLRNPTYRNHAQHVEAVKVTFDPQTISYDEILDYYWRHIDPTDNGGKPFAAPIRVPVLPAKEFWLAEEYHQDYYKKNPGPYNRYRKGCRRDAVVNGLWGSSKAVKADKSYGSGK